jgi:hypothetical protein
LDIKETIPADRTLSKLLGTLQVYCCYKKTGCPWTGPRENLEIHLEKNCELWPCTNVLRGCLEVMKKTKIFSHSIGCGYSEVSCPHIGKGCDFRCSKNLLNEHFGSCLVLLREQKEAEEKRKKIEKYEEKDLFIKKKN